MLSLLVCVLLSSGLATSEEPPRVCKSVQGEFGSLEGTLQHVPFAYQLELTVGTDIEQVLETVETSLVDQLLPYTFRECTEDDLITDMITGVRGALHNDRPVDGVACTAVVSSPLNICFVVRGHLDVYLAVKDAAAIVRQAIQLDLHAILDHHAVNHVTDGVVAVSFVDVNTLPPEPEPELMSSIMASLASAASVPLHAAVAALLLVALTLTWRQCKSGNNDDEDYLPLQQEEDPPSAETAS